MNAIVVAIVAVSFSGPPLQSKAAASTQTFYWEDFAGEDDGGGAIAFDRFDDMHFMTRQALSWDLVPAYDNASCQFLRKKAFLATEENFYVFLRLACDYAQSLISDADAPDFRKNEAESFIDAVQEFEDALSRLRIETLSSIRDGSLSPDDLLSHIASDSSEFLVADRIGVIDLGILLMGSDPRLPPEEEWLGDDFSSDADHSNPPHRVAPSP